MTTSPVSTLTLVLIPLLAGLAVAAELQDGLQIDVTRPVNCERPSKLDDRISVHYKGSLQDGTVFDSSYPRGQPFTFTIGKGQVIKGWEEGLLGACIGEARTLTVPPALGYGNRAMGRIPAKSTLIFETELMGIAGVEAPATPAEDAPSAPAGDAPEPVAAELGDKDASSAASASSSETASDSDNEQCSLLGPFALVVQGSLGLLALVSLVFKRWRERPRRPLKIWFFDVSKQVFGSALLHVFNVFMSIVSSGAVELSAQAAASKAADDWKPNPCSFYLINIAVDTTLGVPILVLILKVLHHAASLTPLANPPESIKSGHYGTPPSVVWWLKQSVIYFVGLLLMKLCVFALFDVLPVIIWIGNWALRWTEGNQALQIAFVMFLFPLIANSIQYYIIDTFIKEDSASEHQAVPQEEPGEGEDEGLGLGDEEDVDELGRSTDLGEGNEDEQGKAKRID